MELLANIGLICATGLAGFAFAFGVFAGIKAATHAFGAIQIGHTTVVHYKNDRTEIPEPTL